MESNMKEKITKVSTYLLFYIITTYLIFSAIYVSDLSNKHYWLQNIIIFLSFFFLMKYFIYMLVSPWYDTKLAIWKLKKRKDIERYNPKVSVLIPAWNEEVGLLTTVKSVLKSSYQNMEVVIVNDGSTDNSDTMMKKFLAEDGKEFEGKIIYHYQQNGGKGSALNKGISLSTGELIVSIDADCLVDKRAIENFVIHFADREVMAAVGNVKIGKVDTFISTAQYLEFLFSFYFKKADSVLGSIYIIGGAAGVFRKEVFEKLGGYSDTNITEDIELTVRIQQAGMKIVYAADAVVYTEGANDIKSLKKQRLRWKRGRLDTFLKYKNMFFSMKKEHNTFLSWFAMPFAVFGDVELIFEIPFLSFIIILAYISHDFTPFIGTMLVVAFVFLVQSFGIDSRNNNKKLSYLLAPIGWLVFIIITYVELTALVLSFKALYTGETIRWQRWQRKGIK